MDGGHAHAVSRTGPWLLHARARGMPAALVGWVALAGVVAIGHATADTGSTLVAAAHAAVPVVAGVFAALLAAGCLAGHDELEESTSRTTRSWRLRHWLALIGLAVGVPAAGWSAASAEAVREPVRLALVTVGLSGVAALGAVLLGGARAWGLVLGHVLAGAVLAPVEVAAGPGRWLLATVTWPGLPTGTPLVLAASATAAVGLLAVGARAIRP